MSSGEKYDLDSFFTRSSVRLQTVKMIDSKAILSCYQISPCYQITSFTSFMRFTHAKHLHSCKHPVFALN